MNLLETRKCVACNVKKFTVPPNSDQRFCSVICEQSGVDVWRVKNLKKNGENNMKQTKMQKTGPAPSVVEGYTPMMHYQSKKRTPEANLITSSKANTTMDSEKSDMQKTETPSEKQEILGTSKTEMTTISKNEPVETTGSRAARSKEHLELSEAANAVSGNLLDKSAQHLFSLMNGLTNNVPDPSCKAIPGHIADTAVNLAAQINELIKTKVATMKVIHEINTGGIDGVNRLGKQKS